MTTVPVTSIYVSARLQYEMARQLGSLNELYQLASQPNLFLRLVLASP
ncbi:hypothetical protein imdm_1014 [gamma proteobacterium IMCC2047]|nr:hypothetical protein imdm_1014 [gamma proteobacterium IMCC2047]